MTAALDRLTFIKSFKLRILITSFLAASGLLTCPSSQASESVRIAGIEKDAVLKLQDGDSVQLSGLELPEESIPLLGILVGGKDVEMEEDSTRQGSSENPVKQTYLYVKTSELELPFADAVPAKEKKIMINELLVAIGAARVTRSVEFEHKKSFIELEDKARLEGQGLWSYEVVSPDVPAPENI